MLDDDRRRRVELQQQAERGREVEHVVVAELGTVQLLHRRQPDRRCPDDTIEHRRLVRVLPVAEIHLPLELQRLLCRILLSRILRIGVSRTDRAPGSIEARRGGWGGKPEGSPHLHQISVDGLVITRRASERLTRQAEAGGVAELAPARRQLVEDRAVLAGVGHDTDAAVVLGGGADHRRPADVDLLDRLGQGHPGLGHRRLERIERHDDQVDRRNAVAREGLEVGGDVATGQDAAVDLRVQRLHPAVEHLRKPGDVGHVAHGQPRVAQELRGAAGREELDPQPAQLAGEIDDARLVVDRHQRATHLHRRASAFTMTCLPTIRKRPSANRRIASG